MAANLETTKRAYELFQRGEIATLIAELVDDDCTWIAPGPTDTLPWAGHFKGKQGVAAFFTAVGQNLAFTEFVPRQMLEQGDTVVVIGTSIAVVKKTGKTVTDDWVHVFRFGGGRLVYFHEYIDTAASVRAFA